MVMETLQSIGEAIKLIDTKEGLKKAYGDIEANFLSIEGYGLHQPCGDTDPSASVPSEAPTEHASRDDSHAAASVPALIGSSLSPATEALAESPAIQAVFCIEIHNPPDPGNLNLHAKEDGAFPKPKPIRTKRNSCVFLLEVMIQTFGFNVEEED
ncbi:hypothetical protein SAY86_006133 [Trapa natans]|uniref:Uncharacterized protein n=1 Tax=Trapa natans TaxID=22666 RepID=A0AAN7L4P7_TRANT|nr:hypothetical protein SAY86_006133 [Trapa natans]